MECSLNYLKNKSKEMIERNNYKIIEKIVDDEYRFYICQKSSTPCDNGENDICDNGSCTISRVFIVLGESRIVQDRSSRSQSKKNDDDKDAFTISWIGTDKGHRGEQLALFLLIYSISYCYLLLPHVKYFVLDDDSNLSNKVSSIQRNIYDMVGFHYKDLISIQDMKRGVIILKLSGPDKQVGCSRFIERSLEIINQPLRQRSSKSTLTTRERERQRSRSTERQQTEKHHRTRSRSRDRQQTERHHRTRSRSTERQQTEKHHRTRSRSTERQQTERRSTERQHRSRSTERRSTEKQRPRSRSREKERHKERHRPREL